MNHTYYGGVSFLIPFQSSTGIEKAGSESTFIRIDYFLVFVRLSLSYYSFYQNG